MGKNNKLEKRVAKLLEGKTIRKADLSSYDDLIEVDSLYFTDGTCIKFGMRQTSALALKQYQLQASEEEN